MCGGERGVGGKEVTVCVGERGYCVWRKMLLCVGEELVTVCVGKEVAVWGEEVTVCGERGYCVWVG